MAKAPAFQFYANDFMDATRLWDANACGLYVRCICIQWTHGGIPSDMKLLSRALHCDLEELEGVWPVIGPKFEAGEDGLLRNRRLEAVRSRQEEVSGRRKAAANARWGASASASSVADANAMQMHMQRKVKVKSITQGGKVRGASAAAAVTGASGAGSEGEDGRQEAQEVAKREADGVISGRVVDGEGFEAFWALYDKKRGKDICAGFWSKMSEEEREAAMEHAGRYVAVTPKEYRKDPERYLKHKAWNDEVIPRTRTNEQRQEPVIGSIAARIFEQLGAQGDQDAAEGERHAGPGGMAEHREDDQGARGEGSGWHHGAADAEAERGDRGAAE